MAKIKNVNLFFHLLPSYRGLLQLEGRIMRDVGRARDVVDRLHHVAGKRRHSLAFTRNGSFDLLGENGV